MLGVDKPNQKRVISGCQITNVIELISITGEKDLKPPEVIHFIFYLAG